MGRQSQSVSSLVHQLSPFVVQGRVGSQVSQLLLVHLDLALETANLPGNLRTGDRPVLDVRAVQDHESTALKTAQKSVNLLDTDCSGLGERRGQNSGVHQGDINSWAGRRTRAAGRSTTPLSNRFPHPLCLRPSRAGRRSGRGRVLNRRPHRTTSSRKPPCGGSGRRVMSTSKLMKGRGRTAAVQRRVGVELGRVELRAGIWSRRSGRETFTDNSSAVGTKDLGGARQQGGHTVTMEAMTTAKGDLGTNSRALRQRVGDRLVHGEDVLTDGTVLPPRSTGRRRTVMRGDVREGISRLDLLRLHRETGHSQRTDRVRRSRCSRCSRCSSTHRSCSS